MADGDGQHTIPCLDSWHSSLRGCLCTDAAAAVADYTRRVAGAVRTQANAQEQTHPRERAVVRTYVTEDSAIPAILHEASPCTGTDSLLILQEKSTSSSLALARLRSVPALC